MTIAAVPSYTNEQLAAIESMTRGDWRKFPMGILAGGPGTGKAQPVDATVLTPNGFVPMGSVQVGDKVMGRAGKPVLVIGVYPQGTKPVFRVTTQDGRSTECCDDHLWLTMTRNERRRGTVGTVKTLNQIRSSMTISNGPNAKRSGPTRLNHRLPHLSPCVFDGILSWEGRQLSLFGSSSKTLPLHPYLVGALIGDGTLYPDSILFTNCEDDVIQRLRALLPETDTIVPKLSKTDKYTYRLKRKVRRWHVPSGTMQGLRLLGLDGHGVREKFIPSLYLYASVEDRVWLLRGLCDTDGSVSGQRIDFSSVCERLAREVVFLARSLGGITKLRPKKTSWVYKGKKQFGLSYRLSIWLPDAIVPVASKKHLSKWRARGATYYTRIASVEPVGEKPCVCIQVAAPDGLYVTDDFIVTHNTTVSRETMTRWAEEYGEFNIVALSPTGKAARRFAEVTGFPCHTIHMALLMWEKELARGPEAGRDSLLPSIRELKAVIVDESSMVDMYLLDRLLSVLPPLVQRILFVGDPDQLPSVGPGCILRDLIDGNRMPVFRLEKIFRQSEHSWISMNARQINKGQMPIVDPDSVDYFQHSLDDHQAIRDKVRDIVKERPNAQVLTPSHKLLIGAEAMNEMVRETVNPSAGRPGWKAGRTLFHKDDRVIHKKNNYKLGVMNGEVGRAVSVEKIDVRGKETPHLVVDYDGVLVRYDEKTAGDQLRLAFALTIHSSQGSEYDEAIIVLHSSHYYLLSRQLAYTGITRAKKAVFVVGDQKGLSAAVKRNNAKERETRLKERIHDAFATGA